MPHSCHCPQYVISESWMGESGLISMLAGYAGAFCVISQGQGLSFHRSIFINDTAVPISSCLTLAAISQPDGTVEPHGWRQQLRGRLAWSKLGPERKLGSKQ